jgi:YesN/AraC family two-component response regulator
MIPSLLIGVFAYVKIYSNFQVEISKYNLRALEYIKEEVTNMFNAANMISLQYSMNSDVKYFLDKDFSSDRIAMTKLFQDINNTILSNPFIDSIYIYYDHNGQLITKNGQSNLKNFYDQGWSEQRLGNSTYAFLPTRKVIEKVGDNENEKLLISLVRAFPMFTAQRLGEIVININTKDVQSKISRLGRQEQGNIFMIDRSGKILISDSEDYTYRNLYDIIGTKLEEPSGYIVGKFQGNKCLISYTPSFVDEWIFVQLTPMEKITKNIDFIKSALLAVLIIMTIIVLCIVVFIVNRVYAYITQIMDVVNKENEEESTNYKMKNEAEALQSGIKNISVNIEKEKRKNLLLRKQIDENKFVVLKSMLKDILLSSDINEDEVVEKLDLFGFPRNGYIVLIIKMDDYNELHKKWNKEDECIWKFSIINISEEIVNKDYKGLVFENNTNEWVIAVHMDKEKESDVYYYSERLADEIRISINRYVKEFTVSVAIGSICEDIIYLSQSYNDALKLMRNRWLKGKNITIKYIENLNSKNSYYYNVQAEKIIINCLKKNDISEAKKVLDQFAKELLERNSYEAINVFEGMQQLLGAVIRMIYDMGYSLEEVFFKEDYSNKCSMIDEFRSIDTLYDAVNWMKQRFNSISDFLWEKRNNKLDNSINDIVLYINENYQKDIYLSSISEKFSISETYLSKTFKQTTGENFLDYLTRIRLDKAKELLKNVEISVHEVSKAVGYANVQTFIRVFKKYEGTTPGQYKDGIKNFKKDSV